MSTQKRLARILGKGFKSRVKFEGLTHRVESPKRNPGWKPKFPDKFWKTDPVVVNCLDNVPSRLYLSSLSTLHSVPLIDLGTLGLRGSVQFSLPFWTERYQDSPAEEDDDTSSIPVCTVKQFPYEVEHCVSWAQGVYEEHLAGFAKKNKGAEIDGREGGKKECAAWGVELYEELFVKEIEALATQYPEDHVDDDTKAPFWSGSRSTRRIRTSN